MLNHHLSFGHSTLALTGNSREGYKTCVKIEPRDLLNWPLFEAMRDVLLVHPAFILTQELKTKWPGPRFAKQCHALSCLKLFYTQRSALVVCRGSQGHKKAECALEWKLFRAWLKDTIITASEVSANLAMIRSRLKRRLP